MNFYIVMQGRTYAEEKQHEVICSSKTDKIGQPQHFWERMKDVRRGDVVFHYVKGDIVAISTVTAGCKISSKPYDGTGEVGYVVESNYEELDVPLTVKDVFTQLTPLMPVKYSAFQENGDGNQGFLYPCNEILAIKLLTLISDQNIFDEDEQLEFAMGPVIVKERDTLATLLIEAEAKAQKKMRKARAEFEEAMAPLWEHHCALCDIQLPALLRASYSKPWKDATDAERVDASNGLMLCANHDALYQEGFIAFDGTGKLHISSEIAEEDYAKFGLHDRMKVPRTQENKPYFKWHKREVFRGE